MTAQGAAPVGGTTGSGYIDNGDTPSIPQDALPAHVIERLRAEGISSLDQWRVLGPRRLQIFGITKAMVVRIDALAAGGAS